MQIRVYTDGACSGNPGPGGWAMVFNTDKQCKTYGGYDVETTNNRMELTAVNQCLKKISKHKSKDDVFEIYSDSAYVINAIVKKWLQGWLKNGWKTKTGDDIKNRDLWEQTIECLQLIETAGQKVTFIKIKGHAGNTFNEMVDKLAKEQSLKAQSVR
jgi:ribonuclease HI